MGCKRKRPLRTDGLYGRGCPGPWETREDARAEGFPEEVVFELYPKTCRELARQRQQRGRACCGGGGGRRQVSVPGCQARRLPESCGLLTPKGVWGRPRGLKLGNALLSVLSLDSLTPQNVHKRERDSATVAVLTTEEGELVPQPAGPLSPPHSWCLCHPPPVLSCGSLDSGGWKSERGLVWLGLPLLLGSGAPSQDSWLGARRLQPSRAECTHACAHKRWAASGQDAVVPRGGLPSLHSVAAQGRGGGASDTSPNMRGRRGRPKRRCQQLPSPPHPCLIWGLAELAERVGLFPGPPNVEC